MGRSQLVITVIFVMVAVATGALAWHSSSATVEEVPLPVPPREPSCVFGMAEACADPDAVVWLALDELTEWPNELTSLPNLRELQVRHGRFPALPPTLGQLSTLHMLEVSFMPQLTSLPPEVGLLTELRVLDISYTGIQHLPPEIGKLRQLQCVVVQPGQLNAQETARLKAALPNVYVHVLPTL